MPKYALHIALIALLLSSCGTQYDIAGNSSLEEVDGRMLYLRVTAGDSDFMVCSLDSCQVEHGRFRFGGDVDSIMLAQVYMGNDLMMPIVIEDGPLQVSIDQMGQYVEGGRLNKVLYKFLEKRDQLESKIWQAENACIRALREGNENPASVREKMRRRTNSLNKEIEDEEVRFIKDNYDNALGPGYFIMLCNQQIFPEMTAQFHRIVDDAPQHFLLNPFINNYLHMAGYDFSRQHKKGKKNKWPPTPLHQKWEEKR